MILIQYEDRYEQFCQNPSDRRCGTDRIGRHRYFGFKPGGGSMRQNRPRLSRYVRLPGGDERHF